MKKLCSAILLMAVFTTLAFGQELSQTVRGTIKDTDSKLPLVGATIVIIGSDPLIGTVTDIDGNFRLEKVLVGRISLQLAYLGYIDKTVPNVVVNSGKETILSLDMEESIIKMDEFVIKATENKGDVLNDMALISGRSISIEETERHAGSFNDPSRILANFAGVTSSQDGDNTIIVRGNSPKYVQWRLEGLEITNPNHFADQNGVSGGISTLNNNLLATSDFYTGAFSPEYGDVLSGVYDVKLRAGNNEKFESVLGVGLLGTDLTVEGPFKKGYTGSFLANYRYSNIALIDNLNMVDIGGVPVFQDGALKIVLPTKKMGVFSLFGLGGLSNFKIKDIKPSIWATPGDNGMKGDVQEDFEKKALLLNAGLSHTLQLTNNSFIKTSGSYSANGIEDNVFEAKTIKILDEEGNPLKDSIVNRKLNFKSKLMKTTYRGALTYNNKINARNKIQIGTRYTLFDYDYHQSLLHEDGLKRLTVVDFKENINTVRNFVSWKYRLNENITLVSGLHNMNVLYNKKSTLEPRAALSWNFKHTNSINVGYGKHSNMESIHNYFTKVELEDGTITEPNKDLDLLKAHHFVLGYEKRFSENLRGKVEAYYQHLYDLPVENNDTSFYATINEGLEFRYVDLVNKGTGKNYGVELTFERFFSKNYYYLINGSLYNSTYKSLEGVERNTQYNGNYLVNILFGKEFTKLGKKDNQTLSLNAKIFFGGGQKYIPLLRDKQGDLAVDPEKGKFWDYEKAYEDKLEDIYTVVVSASYKFNRPKTTHEFYLNLDNITNNKGKISEFYDENEPDNIGYVAQFGLFPNLMYKVYF